MKNYSFGSFYRGDTWPGFQMSFTEDGAPMDLSGATIRSEFRQDRKDGPVQREISDQSGIATTGASGGVIVLEPFVLNVPVGRLWFDIEVDANGTITTFLTGYIDVVQDVTQ